VIVGFGLTVTVVVTALLVHDPPPTTLYVVVTVGLAVTTEPEVELKPVDGLQVYEVKLPEAVSVVELPLHMVAVFTVGVGQTIEQLVDPLPPD
jgi:hypothetical protein